MSNVSDAAAMIWAIKNNTDVSSCMTNQIQMYKKGVLDGKDKDTIIDEDWTYDDGNIIINIDTNGNNIPNDGLGPGFVNPQKGVFWKLSRNNLPEYYIRFWVSPTPVAEFNWGYSLYYRETGTLHLTAYEDGVIQYDKVATFLNNHQQTGAFHEEGITYKYPSVSKLSEVHCEDRVEYAGTLSEYHIIQISYNYIYTMYDNNGAIANKYVRYSGTSSFPGYGLSSEALYGVTNVSCTSEAPDFLQTI